MTSPDPHITAVQNWVRQVVIGLNVCPFANREFEAGRVKFSVSEARTAEELLHALADEMHWLDTHPETGTTLLIHPHALKNFEAYNQFLDLADGLVESLDRDGIYQIASFHPGYQFADTAPDAAENFTNRSPYPMLHLLREEDLAAAIDAHPDPEGIPDRNIARLQEIGAEELISLLNGCYKSAS